MESPGSPLSEHSDDEFQDQEDPYHRTYMSGASPSPTEPSSARPSKRQKTGAHTHRERDSREHGSLSGSIGHQGNFDTLPPPLPDEDLTSDTEGSVPGSPHMAATAAAALPGDEDDGGFGHKGEQISFCRWDGCPAGELGNMDLLVQHLHDEHIHARQKKYSCEWADCIRKGIAHASGYALRAHMRSHTREKPFYCTLPECDRSFTRSDALAKHMRTVHETEALRPSDPVPKHHSSNPQNKHQKLRLTFKNIGNGSNGAAGGGPGSDAGKSSVPASPMTGPSHAALADEDYEHNNVVYVPARTLPERLTASELVRQFPPDIQFTDKELALDPAELYKLLHQQLRWASEDGEALRNEVLGLEEKRRREWISKELVLENLMEAEAEGAQRKKGVPNGVEEEAVLRRMKEDVARTEEMELSGVNGEEAAPWWRLPRRSRDDEGGAMEGVESAAPYGTPVVA